MSQTNSIETIIKPKGRGRPRKYLMEESKTKYKENALKYNKEHAEILRKQNRENYARKKLYINELERQLTNNLCSGSEIST